jgi:ubiquinone/menaquinone biosynthesis C-methylase UbiE
LIVEELTSLTMTRRKQESLETFNKVACEYDSRYENYSKSMHPFILEELRRAPFASILDVGCGTGTILSMVGDGVRKAGLDISPPMVSKARQKLGADADLRVRDSEFLPWPDDSFDVVICNLSFHHYEHPQTVLKEMRRVLKNAGRVIIGDIYQPFPWHTLANLPVRFSHEGDVHIYSEKEITLLLKRTDLQDIFWKRTSKRSFVATARVFHKDLFVLPDRSNRTAWWEAEWD